LAREVVTRKAFDELISHHPNERERMTVLRNTLRPYSSLFEGRRVVDYGASFGLSGVVLLELGAESVLGVETDAERVRDGNEMLGQAGLGSRVQLSHVADTRALPVGDLSIPFVLANAVLEHIPQPRAAYIEEVWRVLAYGGALLINETPNKYLPVDFHTLHLPLTNWLPSRVAHRIGVLTGRFRADRTVEDWESSGWRGLGYYELVRAIPGQFTVVPETGARFRHRALRALGLPGNLFDPYPIHILVKMS
jgi:SAM-dependent methyltransferase